MPKPFRRISPPRHTTGIIRPEKPIDHPGLEVEKLKDLDELRPFGMTQKEQLKTLNKILARYAEPDESKVTKDDLGAYHLRLEDPLVDTLSNYTAWGYPLKPLLWIGRAEAKKPLLLSLGWAPPENKELHTGPMIHIATLRKRKI